jgi:hypothetical protein
MARIRRTDSYRRRAPVKEPYDTVLIVCEGRKTEPNYLNGLRAAHRLSSANIAVTHAPGTDPMTIVTYTEQLMAEEQYDRAFSVFDRDTHANFDDAVRRVRDSVRGREGTWHAVTSTPSFELWLLLHYRYSTAPIVRSGQHSPGDMAVRALRDHLPDYQKGHGGIFDRVAGLTDAAVANAKKLSQHNANSQSNNPATGVHELVEYLRKLKS